MTKKELEQRVADLERQIADKEQSRQYNGWTNYETWLVKLWIDNDEGSYRYWLERAQEVYDNATPNKLITGHTRLEAFVYDLSKAMESEIEEGAGELFNDSGSMYCDLLNGALSNVNWYEIAEHYKEEITEETTDDETEEVHS